MLMLSINKVTFSFTKEEAMQHGKDQVLLLLEGQQILVKYGSFYVRVHSCNVQLRDSFSNNIPLESIHLDTEPEVLFSKEAIEEVLKSTNAEKLNIKHVKYEIIDCSYTIDA